MPDLGKIAYEAYAERVGNKTPDEEPLPKWHDLGDLHKAGWGAAADAVRAAFSR